MKALLIWNNLRADRCLDFIHPLPGTSDIVYLSCVLKTVSSQCGPSLFLYPSSHLCLWLFPFCLVFPAPSLTLHLHFAACVCFSPFPVCADGFLINSLFPLFLSPLIPSFRFSSSYPPTSFPFFLPRLLSSLSPYSEGIQWIIQKRCRMIMGN